MGKTELHQGNIFNSNENLKNNIYYHNKFMSIVNVSLKIQIVSIKSLYRIILTIVIEAVAINILFKENIEEPFLKRPYTIDNINNFLDN